MQDLPLFVHSVDRQAADQVGECLPEGGVDGFDSKLDRCQLDSLGVTALMALEDSRVVEGHGLVWDLELVVVDSRLLKL